MKIIETFVQDLTSQITDIVMKGVNDAINKCNVQPAKEEKEYLSRKEAAYYLKISMPTLDKATRDGAIKSLRIMGSIRYLKNDLDCAMTLRKFSKFQKGGENGK